jgi:hypothetical protein
MFEYLSEVLLVAICSIQISFPRRTVEQLTW